jgi:hypothetical protein
LRLERDALFYYRGTDAGSREWISKRMSNLKESRMAKNSNAAVRVVGLVLLVVGAGLAYWGYQMSGSLTSQLTRTISGSQPDEVMYRYIGSAVCGIVGLFLLVKK